MSLGAFGSVLFYLAGKEAYGKREALIAGIIAASFNIFIFNEAAVLKNGISSVLTGGLLLFLVRGIKQRGYFNFFLSGLFLVLITSVRPNALILLFALVFFFLFFLKEFTLKDRLVKSVIFSAGFLTLFIPFFLLAKPYNVSGIHFYIGNHKGANGYYSQLPEVRNSSRGHILDAKRVAEFLAKKELTSGEVSNFWFKKGFDYIKEEPADFARLMITKIRLFFNSSEALAIEQIHFFPEIQKFNTIPVFSYPFITVAGLAGIFFSFRKNIVSKMIFLMAVSYMISVTVLFVATSYRQYFAAFLILPSGYFISSIIGRFLEKRYAAFFSLILISTCLIAVLKTGESTFNSYQLARSYFLKGTVYRESGDLKNAFYNAEKALTIDSESIEAQMLKADIFIQTGLNDEALSILDNLKQKYPVIWEVHFNRGAAYLNKNESRSAIENFKNALSIQPLEAKIWGYLALAYARKADYNEGEKAIKTGIQMAGEDLQIRETAGWFYFLKGDFVRTVKELDKVEKLGKKDAKLYYNRGLANLRLKNYEDAEADFKRAISKDENFYICYEELGYLYLEKKEYDKSRKAFINALKINPDAERAKKELVKVLNN